MEDEREIALKVAIKSILLAAKRQGMHVEALCDGAVELIGGYPGLDRQGVVAANAIRRMAYEILMNR